MKHLVLLLCIVGSAFASITPDKPFIYSVGTSVARVRPDVLVINFSVAAADLSQTKANEIAEEKTKSVFKVLREFAIPPSDIDSANIVVSREYSRRDNDDQPKRFIVRRDFVIRFRQIELVGEFVKQLSVVQMDSLGEITGEVSIESKIREELKLGAVADARKKADQIANAAGMKIIGVYAISPIASENIEREFLRTASSEIGIRHVAYDMAPPITRELTFIFPDVVFAQSVHVIYYISEK